MWAVGCIFAEMLMKEPLMPGQTEIQMIERIFKTLGTPNDEVWPGFSELPSVKKMKFKVRQPILSCVFSLALILCSISVTHQQSDKRCFRPPRKQDWTSCCASLLMTLQSASPPEKRLNIAISRRLPFLENQA